MIDARWKIVSVRSKSLMRAKTLLQYDRNGRFLLEKHDGMVKIDDF